MKGVKGEIDQRPARFYREVGVVALDGGWGVTLDGRGLRTPAKQSLVLRTQALAEAVAGEWRIQEERIDLLRMHVTRLANVAVDRTPAARGELAAEAAKYAETDLLCHLAENPAALRARQEAAWSPLRAWAEAELGVRLVPVEGIVAARQPEASLAAVRAHAMALDDFRLTGLVHGVGLFGSAILALAVERRRLHAEDAFTLSRIDEDFQISQWGEDAEAARMAGARRIEALALDRWFDALGDG